MDIARRLEQILATAAADRGRAAGLKDDAAKLVDEARAQASQIVGDAQDRANQVNAEAARRAADLSAQADELIEGASWWEDLEAAQRKRAKLPPRPTVTQEDVQVYAPDGQTRALPAHDERGRM